MRKEGPSSRNAISGNRAALAGLNGPDIRAFRCANYIRFLLAADLPTLL